MNAIAHDTAGQVPERTIPLDLQTMRETALRVLGEETDDLSVVDVESLIQAFRGMLMLLLPEVTAAADRHPRGDMLRVCALVGVEEASRRLRIPYAPSASPWALRHAQRLARSVMVLTDHYVNLGGQA
ncbi:DUF6415 family natural product biosynthesis protein [Streptomyces roseolus]|uniref:DUF6415 family natural product biosynthesis protein n=1 Tax=Streptomyces roseolus TaxID=67358 RepID=UPI003653EA3C